jgi:sterol desaturase/sphingolipid hydroxylase (fatty acid hydroxylase superfamily)
VNTNFALHLPLLDRLFGTQFFPDGRWPERLGVVGEPIPNTWWAQMTYPFRSPAVTPARADPHTDRPPA